MVEEGEKEGKGDVPKVNYFLSSAGQEKACCVMVPHGQGVGQLANRVKSARFWTAIPVSRRGIRLYTGDATAVLY